MDTIRVQDGGRGQKRIVDSGVDKTAGMETNQWYRHYFKINYEFRRGSLLNTIQLIWKLQMYAVSTVLQSTDNYKEHLSEHLNI